MLITIRWVAQHYVAPVSAVAARCAPPNLPRRTTLPDLPDVPATSVPSPLPAVSEAAAAGRHLRAHYLISPASWTDAVTGLVTPVLAAGRSGVVVMPTASEAEQAAAALEERLPGRIAVATGQRHDRDVTAAWQRASSQPGVLLVGSPRILLWPVASLGIGVVVQEGRRGHKERQTPTIHTREVLRRRSAVERFPLVFLGRVPTTELVAAGLPMVAEGRPWPLVEVVDRTTDPSRSLFTDRVKVALAGAVKRAERTLVFTHRHGYAPAFACAQCGTLRVCERCGSRLDESGTCQRCGHHELECRKCGGRRFVALGAGTGRVTAELGRIVDRTVVGPVGSDALVMVGTERDLTDVGAVDLAIAVDADGLLMGTNYRAAEDALRVLARMAATVGRGRGKRAIVQTARPGHPVIAALRRGDPLEFLTKEAADRQAYRLPPSGEIIVLEVSDAPEWTADSIAGLQEKNASVLGPASVQGAARWLLQGEDLDAVRTELRQIVHRLRESGASVRIDVDPIEL